MTDRWDDRELERLMKEGLEARAREAAVDVAVADRARAAAGGARWRTAAAAGLVAASVAGVAGGVALLRDDESRSGGVTGDPTTPTVVDEWRTEYWHDIQVDVPTDWGWGGAPMEAAGAGRGEGGLTACWASAFRGADGAQLSGDVQETTPYVGRPIYLTDLCELFRDDQWPEPTAPYVWLGSPIEPGTREFDNGYVQETREVNGSTITVATDDPALREAILDSATGGETCMSELDTPPPSSPGMPVHGIGDFTGLTVCVYGRETDQGQWHLRYVTELSGSTAQRLFDGADSRPVSTQACPAQDEYVQLELHGSDANGDQLTATYVVQLGQCPLIETLGGAKQLDESVVAPWAVNGVPTALYGPYLDWQPWMSDYFIGPLG